MKTKSFLINEIYWLAWLDMNKKLAHLLYREMDEFNFYERLETFSDDLLCLWEDYSLEN